MPGSHSKYIITLLKKQRENADFMNRFSPVIPIGLAQILYWNSWLEPV